MTDTLVYDDIKRMFSAAAGAIRANVDELSRLDSAIGDGDHGTTMVRTVNALEKGAEAVDPSDFQKGFNDIGWAVMGIDGGSTGPLLGTFFMGMADGVPRENRFDAATLAAMFDRGLAKLQEMSGAGLGDKTMMDAFIPAVEAMKAAGYQHEDIPTMMRKAAEAARTGSDSTRQLVAKFGRARNLGDRVIGHPDPGSVSIALMFRAFADAVAG